MAGVLVMNIMTAGLAGDATWLATMRDRGVLLRLRVAPLGVTDLVAAYAVVRLGLVMLQSALIVGAAMLVFGVRPGWSTVIPAMLVTLIGGVVFLLLGQALAAVSPTASAANVLSNMIYFPILFLSNLVIGIAAFPDWLESIAQWTPAAMLVDVLRPILTADQALHAVWINLVGLLVYGMLALVIVARWFRWETRV
jgi:ABC-2 type transport system permease protein